MGLGRSLYFSGMTSVSKFVIQFGLSIFVARMLTPEELGSFGVALAASAFLRAFESAGVNNFVASYKHLDHLLLRSVFTVNSILNILLALLLWAIAAPIGAFYNSAGIADILEWTALAIALNTHIPIMQGLLRRNMRFKALMGLDLGLMVVMGATTVLAVMGGWGAEALALAIVAERVAGLVVGLTGFRRQISVLPRFQDIRVVLNYGLSLSTATVIGIIGTHSNNFILGKILGLAPAAQFDRGYILPRMMSSLAHMSFHNVLVPEVARQHKDGNPCAPVLQDVCGLYAMVLWPAGLVLAIVSEDVILTLFGLQWLQAAEIAHYFILYMMISSPIAMACSAMVALGHGKALIRNQLAEQLSRIAVFMTAFYFDLHTLAMLLVLPTLIYAVTALTQLNRLDLISPIQFATALVRPIRIALVCTVPALMARWIFMDETYLSLQALIGVAFASALVFVASVKMWEPEIMTKSLAAIGLKPKA